ncbi:MAG TPA: outer membrane beta-barrel protein, partial [Saprospiraceae bacterium]|nr:outer membrane beta-barrel protein [Saprospiraceae bacterium]
SKKQVLASNHFNMSSDLNSTSNNFNSNPSSTNKTLSKNSPAINAHSPELSENNLFVDASGNSVVANSGYDQDVFTERTVGISNRLSSLPTRGIEFLSTEEEIAVEIDGIRPDPSCYKFTGQEKRSNLSMDLFAGPGFGPRAFKGTSTETVLYADARNATETNRYAFAAGGRMNLNLNDEIAVRIGVMYELIGDVFNYQDSGAYIISYDVDSLFSSNGTFLYADTVRIITEGTQVKRIHNRYHHLDIPLLISYELPLGRARLMVNAGPVINLTTRSRGQILDPMLIPRDITQGSQNHLDAYKSNIGLGIYLGAGALIPFNKYFSGLIEPRFLYRIKPVTLDNYPLKEHRHFAGINIGIRYHFD